MKTSIEKALNDPALLGAALGDPATWSAWLAILKAAFGDDLTPAEQKTFEAVAGSRSVPKERVSELWCVVGRRAGKSRIAAAVAVFIACFVPHRLAPGETGYVLALASTQDQAKAVLGYALAFLQQSPILRKLIDGDPTSTEIRLRNNVTISSHVSSFRSVRSKTMLAVICDEISFWRSDESSNPDREVIRAIQPALASTKGMLIGISSPYRKQGILFERHRDYFSLDDDRILVIQAPTRVFNPSISEAVVKQAEKDDPESARSEWHAEFRTDISALFSSAAIEQCVDEGILERPPMEGVEYFAFCDPSGGSKDSFALSISHREGDKAVVDLIREARPPFSPDQIVWEFAQDLRGYGCTGVTSDRYGGAWVVEAFRKQGITVKHSEKSASEIYREALPLINGGVARILDHERLTRQLCDLERRTSFAGREQIGHPPSGHDDVANAVCGAMIGCMTRKPQIVVGCYSLGSGPPKPQREVFMTRNRDGQLVLRRLENL